MKRAMLASVVLAMVFCAMPQTVEAGPLRAIVRTAARVRHVRPVRRVLRARPIRRAVRRVAGKCAGGSCHR